MRQVDFDLLLAGGSKDPSVGGLNAVAKSRGLRILSLVHGESDEVNVSLCIDEGRLIVDGICCTFSAAFCRFDVFADMTSTSYSPSNRSNDWFAFAFGAIRSSVRSKHLNAKTLNGGSSKVFDLKAAADIGLQVPRTIVTNDFNRLEKLASEVGKWIAKPVGGGSYCFPLEEVLDATLVHDGRMPNPAIVQERLTYPEFRVYRIGKRFVTYGIQSASLDYRTDPKTVMKHLPPSALPEDIRNKLAGLGDAAGLDFYACDLKSKPQSGELCFLELNTSPMFAAHDAVSSGAVSHAILDALLL